MSKRKKNSRRDRRKRLRRRQKNAEAHQRTFATIVDEVTGAIESHRIPPTSQAHVTDAVTVQLEETGDA